VHSSTRQTLSYLRNLLIERGIKPKNKLGQNFLIDLNLIDLILRTAEVSREDLVLEVGSGTGGMTARLAPEAGAVLSVEIDEAFASLTEEAVEGQRDHVSLLHADVLKSKNELNPQVLLLLNDLRKRAGTKRIKLVSNLPYAVATPVISNLLLSDVELERMVVTVQWEIAERLMARPRSKEYGALAVLTQSLADVTLVRQLPSSVFWPRPKVTSAIVLIHPSPAKRAHVGDVLRLRHFLRDLYSHRRKNLRGALVSMANSDWTKIEVDERLQGLGIAGTVRAEELDLEQHLRLCQVFGETVEKRNALEEEGEI
jgi:16S rRNA (adenine1518-N6/adenine1519-N6)-dimethyltransferase